MSNESFGDRAKRLAGQDSRKNTVIAKPKFNSKSLKESNDLIPNFKSKTEFFEVTNTQSTKDTD